MNKQYSSRLSWSFFAFVIAACGGCDRAGSGAGQAVKAISGPFGPESSPVAPVLDKGWCGGHGVPESVCTRCDSSLIAKFKEGGDWCSAHDLPETQCTKCHPEVAAKWAALNPNAPPAGDQQAAPAPPSTNSAPPSAIVVEHNGRQFASGESDPLCTIENAAIRFLDPNIPRIAGIEVTTVQPRRMSATIERTAEVEFDATRTARITPRVAGVTSEVLVNIGDSVQVGDMLAVLESGALGEAKSEYIERVQNFRVAQAEHQRAQALSASIERLLASATSAATPAEIHERLEGVPVGEAKARLLRAHASLQLARAEAAREAQLFEKKISAEKDLQAARATLAAAEADFLAQREELAYARERDLLAAERAMRIARGALESIERRLQIFGLNATDIAEIESGGGAALTRYALRSPVAGQVVERHVSAGEAVDATQTLFVIADTSRLWLVVSVHDRDLPALRQGQPVQFTVDGSAGQSFTGRLTWIGSAVDDRTRMIPVRAELENPQGLLRARMFGQARIALRENTEVLSIPQEAVQSDGCCQLAFLRTGENAFAPRKVRLGASANGYVEVLDGLTEGDVIASTGTFLLKTEILKSSIGAGCCEVEMGR